MHSLDIEQLQNNVQRLKDRQAILDCINLHARGHDRFDVDILTASYHPDGIDEHGSAINSGSDYAKWANEIHGKGCQLCLHHITTHTCEINGDVAHAESYVIVGLLNPDGVSVRLINGRYIDKLEKRDDQWRIALRRCTVELLLTGDASLLNHPQFKAGGYIKGVRNKSDVSYKRPLYLESPAVRW